jgi:hypothetical protein
VTPIIYSGIEYLVAGDGTAQYVIARDLKASKVLWKVEIFRTRMNPRLEEDVQWVFITAMNLSHNALLIRDEGSRCYMLDLRSKIVSRRYCW